MSGQTLEPWLKLAVDGAREAGSLLLAAFNRPGGPPGKRDKSSADTDAENLLHKRLLSGVGAGCGWLAEEDPSLGRPADAGGRVWVVDPNDGTASFLRGMRGPSVSIALLQKGVPVLGVVFAYAAPDDDGDMFAWAEGCGPLERNGCQVERAPLASELGAEHTIVLSQHGDIIAETSAANARLSAPARCRPVPSLAYRLALVAAGEADAAVSLAGPSSWDFAAGHALIRASGGVLVDRGGAELTYTRDGVLEQPCRWCIAGHPDVASELAGRDWMSVYVRKPSPPQGPQLAWPLARSHLPRIGAPVLGRAQGALLGQLAGDALGSLVEFQDAGQILMAYPKGPRRLADGGTWNTLAGQPTDDSELALLLGRALLKAGRWDARTVAEHYAFWYDSNPFDIGRTTTTALYAAAEHSDDEPELAARSAAQASAKSQANGALMRISTLAIMGAALPEDVLIRWARLDAALTHPHANCADANAVYAAALAHAVRTGASARETYDHACAVAAREQVTDDVRAWLTTAAEAPPVVDYTDHMGWVRIALGNAFFRLLHSQTLEAAVVETVRCGGDTDTNAAICGALVGAVHGRSGVPWQWQDRVITCRPIAGHPGVHRPRPRGVWPVDALVLAERLWQAGVAWTAQTGASDGG